MKLLYGLDIQQMNEVWREVEISAYMEDVEIVLDEDEDFKEVNLSYDDIRAIATDLYNNTYYEFNYNGYVTMAIKEFLKDGKLW